MAPKPRASFLRFFYQERFSVLFILLLAYIGLAPFLKTWMALQHGMRILFSAVFLSAILAVSQTRLQTVLAILLSLPMLFNTAVLNTIGQHRYDAISHAFSICFLLYVSVMILRSVFTSQRVTRETISAAIVVYLLIGVAWSVMFAWMESRAPGSFQFAFGSASESPYAFIYYSFVTLTTLGYGDVSPLTDPARALVIMEAVIGQLYLTVLIARLVGSYISRARLG